MKKRGWKCQFSGTVLSQHISKAVGNCKLTQASMLHSKALLHNSNQCSYHDIKAAFLLM